MIEYPTIEIGHLENICRKMFGTEYAGKIIGKDVLAVLPENTPVFVGLWSGVRGEGIRTCLTVQANLVELAVSIQVLRELLFNNRGPRLWAFSLEPIKDSDRACVYLGGTQMLSSGMSQELIRSYIATICSQALEIRQWLVTTMGGKELVLQLNGDYE